MSEFDDEISINCDFDDDEISIEFENYEEDKITIDVGGKLVEIKPSILDMMKININNLLRTNENNYFLDRDPKNFSKIKKILEKNFLDIDDKLIDPQLQFEAYKYGIIESVQIKPKIILKKSVDFDENEKIIKILLKDSIALTTSTTISKTNLNPDQDIIDLRKVDGKIFRYILNLLRLGKLYVYSSKILDLLKELNVNFEKCQNISYENDSIVSDVMALTDIPSNLIKTYRTNEINFLGESYPITIPAENTIGLDMPVIFNLSKYINKYNAFFDLELFIDLPKIDPINLDNYHEKIELLMIDSLDFFVIDQNKQSKKILSIIPNANNNSDFSKSYHNLLYSDNLIEILRIKISFDHFKENNPFDMTYFNESNTILVLAINFNKINMFSTSKNINLLNVFLLTKINRTTNKILSAYKNTQKINNLKKNKSFKHFIEYSFDIIGNVLLKELIFKTLFNSQLIDALIDVKIYDNKKIIFQYSSEMMKISDGMYKMTLGGLSGNSLNGVFINDKLKIIVRTKNLEIDLEGYFIDYVFMKKNNLSSKYICE